MSDIIDKTHFTDLIDSHHLLDDAKDRLPGRDGTPGKGLKISEAIPLAEIWWEKNRLNMPDFGKPPEQIVTRSGVLMGLPWIKLNRQEMLRVIAQWYAHVGINLIIDGKSTSQDNAKADTFDKVREDGKKVFSVLDDSGTHNKTNPDLEVEAWKDGYDAIEAEEKAKEKLGVKNDTNNIAGVPGDNQETSSEL